MTVTEQTQTGNGEPCAVTRVVKLGDPVHYYDRDGKPMLAFITGIDHEMGTLALVVFPPVEPIMSRSTDGSKHPFSIQMRQELYGVAAVRWSQFAGVPNTWRLRG